MPERFIITGWLHDWFEPDLKWTMVAPDADGKLAPAHGVAEALPPLKVGQFYEFHVSRDHAEALYRLWHISTIGLNPGNVGIKPVKAPGTPHYCGR